MTRLIPISPKNLEKKIMKLGFRPVRQKGSHVLYRHPDDRTTSIPFHGNYDIGPVLLGKILKEIELNREEYNQL
ncbi:MAG: type II toxin-antitoxin system HicA family toxin [archaeon]|nr:type II toxin-antitoxin system HicA family toxin [archaeon]